MVDIPRIIASLKGKAEISHIAIDTEGLKAWADENKKELSEAIKKHFSMIEELITLQQKEDHRVLSINLRETSDYLKELKDFFTKLAADEKIHSSKTRIFVIGQWYDLDSDLADTIKNMMEKTKDNDGFFLNFCLNYDGQEEILGAIRLAVRKIIAEKMKEEDLNKAVIKDNIYSSYFPPPELIIQPGKSYHGLLLWDSPGAKIFMTGKPWLEFERSDLDDAVRSCRK